MSKKQLKIETYALPKGGGGKTTTSYNRACRLAEKGYQVLTVSGDCSKNIDNTFQIDEEITSTIFDVFTGGEVKIYETDKENIFMIPGDERLTDAGIEIHKVKSNHFKIFAKWVNINYEFLNDTFDYIIIDTHNDASEVTGNFIYASSVVIAPSNPDKNGYSGWIDLQNFINKIVKETEEDFTGKVTCFVKPYLLANRVTVGQHPDDLFISQFSEEENFIGFLPQRKIFIKSLLINKSIFQQIDEMYPSEAKRYEELLDNINKVYAEIDKADAEAGKLSYIVE